MAVIGVTVVRGSNRDNRLEFRRSSRGDLKGVKAAPRNSHHANIAGTPGLVGDPRQHLDAVILLFLRIFVVEDSFRLARAAEVDSDRGITKARKIWMHHLVHSPIEIPLPIRDCLEDRWNGSVIGR